jgi:hypothetical protein
VIPRGVKQEKGKGEAQGERSRIDDVDGFSKGDPNFEKEK